MTRLYFTRRGYQLLEARIARLEQHLKEMYAPLAYLAEVGGDQYHDNFSYEQQMRDIQLLNDEMRRLKGFLPRAVIVEQSPAKPQEVSIGTTVEIEINTEKATWEIVGFEESDPQTGRLAYNTPLGSALMRLAIGETTMVKLNGQEKEITILSIREAAWQGLSV